jgi:hypothetical protein
MYKTRAKEVSNVGPSIGLVRDLIGRDSTWQTSQKSRLWRFLVYLEAATGIEPVKNGFADRCLVHLAMPP